VTNQVSDFVCFVVIEVLPHRIRLALASSSDLRDHSPNYLKVRFLVQTSFLQHQPLHQQHSVVVAFAHFSIYLSLQIYFAMPPRADPARSLAQTAATSWPCCSRCAKRLILYGMCKVDERCTKSSPRQKKCDYCQEQRSHCVPVSFTFFDLVIMMPTHRRLRIWCAWSLVVFFLYDSEFMIPISQTH